MLKFENCKSPLVGVEYVVRYRNNINKYFVCTLCDKRGNYNNIKYHLISSYHRMRFLRNHFPIIANQLSSRHLDLKKSSYLLSHLIEKAYGRKTITILDDQIENTINIRCILSRMNTIIYEQENLQNVKRIISFLMEQHQNYNKYLSKNKTKALNIRNVNKSKLRTYTKLLEYGFDILDLKYEYYKKFPIDHPEYESERLTYRSIFFSKNLSNYEQTAGWKNRWDAFLQESYMMEEFHMKEEIRMQLNLPLDNKQKAPSSTAIKHTTVQKAPSSTAIKPITLQVTTELLHKRNCDKQQEVIPVKRIKKSKNKRKSVLIVEKMQEKDGSSKDKEKSGLIVEKLQEKDGPSKDEVKSVLAAKKLQEKDGPSKDEEKFVLIVDKLQEKDGPSKDEVKSVLAVDKLQEKDDAMTLLSICQQLKSYVMGDLAVKIIKLFNEASKSCDDNNLDVLQDNKNVKLLEKVKLILIDQTSDNWLPASKTNEIKEVIKSITVLLKKVENQQTTMEQSYEFLSEEDIKILVLNFSELASEDQNDLVNYFEIMKVKNNELYNKITNIIQQEIALHSENESLFVGNVNDEPIVDKIIDELIVVISDDEDDYDLAEVVLKANKIVHDISCEFVSDSATNEIPTYEISSDEN